MLQHFFILVLNVGYSVVVVLKKKRENLHFQDLRIPLFQACPDQKLSLSRSETVQIRVVHCTFIFKVFFLFFFINLNNNLTFSPILPLLPLLSAPPVPGRSKGQGVVCFIYRSFIISITERHRTTLKTDAHGAKQLTLN